MHPSVLKDIICIENQDYKVVQRMQRGAGFQNRGLYIHKGLEKVISDIFKCREM